MAETKQFKLLKLNNSMNLSGSELGVVLTRGNNENVKFEFIQKLLPEEAEDTYEFLVTGSSVAKIDSVISKIKTKDYSE